MSPETYDRMYKRQILEDFMSKDFYDILLWHIGLCSIFDFAESRLGETFKSCFDMQIGVFQSSISCVFCVLNFRILTMFQRVFNLKMQAAVQQYSLPNLVEIEASNFVRDRESFCLETIKSLSAHA